MRESAEGWGRLLKGGPPQGALQPPAYLAVGIWSYINNFKEKGRLLQTAQLHRRGMLYTQYLRPDDLPARRHTHTHTQAGAHQKKKKKKKLASVLGSLVPHAVFL